MSRGYRFGDGTKFLLGKVGSAVKSYTGKDSYQFGDLTRATLTYVFTGWTPQQYRDETSLDLFDMDLVSSVPDYDETAKTEEEATGPAVPAAVSLENMWGSFFYGATIVGKNLITAGLMTREDVEAEEPFLYIGLTAVTFLEALLRSTSLPQGIALAAGVIVTATNCPADVRTLIEEAISIKRELAVMGLKFADTDLLRRTCLNADAAAGKGTAVPDERAVILRRIAARVCSLATMATQYQFYKANFSTVLEKVAADSEAKLP